MLAAQAMDAATKVCNAALEGGQAEKKGVVIVGTVQGDVHDIGKAIVIAYLKAHGYEVTDCGRDTPAETFISKAKELHADIIGMSALLTTTMEEQRRVIKIIKDENLPFKTVVAAPPARSAGPTRSAPTPTPKTPPTASRRSTPCWAGKHRPRRGPALRPRPAGDTNSTRAVTKPAGRRQAPRPLALPSRPSSRPLYSCGGETSGGDERPRRGGPSWHRRPTRW